MTTSAELIELARVVRLRAYAPVSGYRVGAALIGDDGAVYTGCNVEHVVLHETVCAEKVALTKGISEGTRRFPVAAVFTDSDPPASPCGSCRQMLHAWGVERVIVGNGRITREISMAELLPFAFELVLPTRGAP